MAPFGLEVLLAPIALCMVMHVFNFLVFTVGKVCNMNVNIQKYVMMLYISECLTGNYKKK